jgi:GNAT superfamily N-acetyltransferase
VTVHVRRVGGDDLPVLLDLIDGLADYEKLARPDDAARGRLARDALADPAPFHVLLADIDGTSVGYAFYFFTYSTFLARPTLYLEDIFVLPAWRAHGAGFALFRACVSEAVARECGRMDWQVLSWNEPAIKFYERLGAHALGDWLPFRLDAAGLRRLAHSAE